MSLVEILQQNMGYSEDVCETCTYFCIGTIECIINPAMSLPVAKHGHCQHHKKRPPQQKAEEVDYVF